MTFSAIRAFLRDRSPEFEESDHETSVDAIDAMDFLGGFEDPDQYEQIMARIYSDAKSDDALAQTLKFAYLEEDVAASFELYANSTKPSAIIDLMSFFGIGKQYAIVDVGCGRGHCAYALHLNGFVDLSAMDPNSRTSTGTGYLASLRNHNIHIINELSEWRSICGRFDAAVSTATVHHWGHIPHCAIDLRRTLKRRGLWIMITEYFANDGAEFAALLGSHPIAKRYGTYEWPYPASAYVDLVQSVGFKLIGVVPLHYAGNKFYGVPLPEPYRFNSERFTRKVDRLLRRKGATVAEFWDEVDEFRRKASRSQHPLFDLYAKRFYSNPQALVFERVEI